MKTRLLKCLPLVALFIALALASAWGAASDYKVDNLGNVRGYSITSKTVFLGPDTPEYYGGIAGDGVSDLVPIALALAATDNCVLSDGEWDLSTKLEMDSNQTIRALNPRKATIKLLDGADTSAIYLDTKTNVQIVGLVIDHNGANQSTGAGIYLADSDHCSIIDCEVKNGIQGNIYLNGTDGIYSHHNTISRCYLHDSTYYSGLNLRNAQWNTISNCQISDSAGAQGNGIGIFTNSSFNAISGCLIEGNSKCGIGMGGGNAVPPINPCYGNSIINCIVRNNTENGIDIHWGAHETSVTGCTCYGNVSGIIVIESNQVSIVGNVCRYNTNHGIIVQTAQSSAVARFCQVIGNQCYMNGRHGIQLYGGVTFCTIQANSCIDNSTYVAGTYAGISLWSATPGNATDNLIQNNITYDTHTGASVTQRIGLKETGEGTTRNRFDGNITKNTQVQLLKAPTVASARSIAPAKYSEVSGTNTVFAILPPYGFAPGEEMTLRFTGACAMSDSVLAVIACTSMTSSDVTAYFTATAPHGLSDGDGVVISGATQDAYNGFFLATVTGATTFTYQFPGAATPATGTPEATLGNLDLAGDLAPAAGTVIKMTWGGVRWHEISRSAN